MAITNTTRLLRNLQMKTYKKTLITLFVLEILITFFISMNQIQSNEGVTPSSRSSDLPKWWYPLGRWNNTSEHPANQQNSNQLFFSTAIQMANIPVNIIGIIVTSLESVYFTLLYIPVRYFFLYCLIRNTLNSPIFSCPLTVDLLVVIIVHMFYVKLYDDKYFWGWSGREGGEDTEFVLDGDDENGGGGGIFNIENHLHVTQLNAPPPSYSEVTSNPFKYPTLVVVEVSEAAAIAARASTSRPSTLPRLEPIAEEQTEQMETRT